jgi:hypothetical protein
MFLVVVGLVVLFALLLVIVGALVAVIREDSE